MIYKSLNNNSKALDYYKKAYEGFKQINQSISLANVVSNLAAIHVKNSPNDSLAINYYLEALSLFKEHGDQIGAAIVYVDLGEHQFNKKNFERALNYYQEGLKQIDGKNVDYLGPKSSTFAILYSRIGRVYSRLGDYTNAITYLEKSLDLATQNQYVSLVETNNLELSVIYEKKAEFSKALEYYKVYEEVGDSILNESSIKRLTQLEMQFEFDKELKQRELEDTIKEADQQRKEFLYLLVIGLGIFIAIIGFLLYANQRNKTSKIELKRKNLKLEHDKLQQELDHRNKELATNVMYLLSKNEFITTTAEKLTKAKMGFKKENQKIIQDVIRDLLMNSSKDVWKEFEVRFQQVHSEFYDNLNNSFPDLTPNEKKICAFLRLNMSTKDIAAITYQSVRSINMARFRLRKKIELESDENLVSYLSQL